MEWADDGYLAEVNLRSPTRQLRFTESQGDDMVLQGQATPQNVISQTIAGLQARKHSLKGTARKRSRRIWYEGMIEYLEAPLKAQKEGRPFGWIEDQGSVELFYAMDVPHFFYEHWSVLAASQRVAVPFLEAAEAYNLKDLCSIHRAYCGALKMGELPRPDFMVGVTGPCDAVIYGMRIAAYSGRYSPPVWQKEGRLSDGSDIPFIQLDSPYWFDDPDIDYYAQEVQSAIDFMEETLNTKLDDDELKQVVERTCEAFRLLGLNNQLAKNVPCPRRSRDLIRDPFILIGSQAAVDYFQAVHEEMLELVEKGLGAIPNERIRLGLFSTPPIGALPFLDEMEKELGAVIVMNTNSAGWQGGDGEDGKMLFPIFPEDPVRTMAAKHLYHYASTCYKDADRFSQVATRIVRDYRLDGVIYCAHWGCKCMCAIIKHIREELQETTGVPTLVLEFDVIDDRTVSIPSLVNQIKEFIEILEQGK